MSNIELKGLDKQYFDPGFFTWLTGLDEASMYATSDVVDRVIAMEKSIKNLKEQYEHLVEYYNALMTDINDENGELTEGFNKFKSQMTSNIDLATLQVEEIKKDISGKIDDFQANYDYTTKSLEVAGDK